MEPVPSQSWPSQTAKRARRRPPRRGRYVSKACLDCRRRKTKCNGQLPCENCLLESIDCRYAAGPARVRKRSNEMPFKASPSPASSGQYPIEASRSQPTQAGLSLLAKDQQQGCQNNNTLESNSTLSLDHSNEAATPFPTSGDSQRKTPRSTAFSPMASTHSACDIDINRWNIQTRLLEVQRMRTMVRHYMDKVNPRVPCLNEAQLYGNIETLLAGKGRPQDQLQLTAMVDLIMAVIQVMTEERVESSPSTVAGCAEFQHAEQILSRVAWDGISNIRSIQCLVLKTMYLIYTNRNDLAYDTVASMARVCFQLGLYNEKDWTLCSPFEVHLRRRIVWTAFCLERHVSETCKLPYLIRHSDLDVALPLHIDDSKLRTDLETLPSEDLAAPIHHIYFCYNHALLFTEIWDCLLGHGAQDCLDEAMIGTLDDRVQSLRSQVPLYLQWSVDRILPYTIQYNTLQHFHIREGLLIHLLLNSLRLLVRHPWIEGSDITSLDMATQCVDIAADTISSLEAYYESTLPDPIERHVSVRYLLQSLRLLAQIILQKPTIISSTISQARASFEKGISLLERFATHLKLAQSGLDEMQESVERISNMREECLLTGSLDDCLQWFDFLAMDQFEEGYDLNSRHSTLQGTDMSAAEGTDRLQYIHTDSWLM